MLAELVPFAVSEENSKGRVYSEAAARNRSQFQRDRDRIIHSSAFRRLEYKTQVFVNHEGDMFRTRLTHSLEVAQIARSIARTLRLNEDLVEAISLAHDLGHTPFGHAGQDILNKCMREFGGFEHNIQSLRIVDTLEEKYAEFSGLNLTFETREGILKHCSVRNAKKLGIIGERFLCNQQPSLEAQIANIADEIAYNNHDLDDGLRAGFLTLEQLKDVKLFSDQYDIVYQKYPSLPNRCAIHEIIRRMIDVQVNDLIDKSQYNIDAVTPSDIDDVRNYAEPLIQFSSSMQEFKQILKKFLRKNLYLHYRVHRTSGKAKLVILSLFDSFMNDIGLLPTEYQTLIRSHEEKQGDEGRARTIADYIAGMTDRYAIAEYNKIYVPGQLT